MAGSRSCRSAAVEHQYLVTEKSPLIPERLPTLRDPDLNFYLKPELGALAIGGWERGTIAVNGLALPLDFGQELFAAEHRPLRADRRAGGRAHPGAQ